MTSATTDACAEGTAFLQMLAQMFPELYVYSPVATGWAATLRTADKTLWCVWAPAHGYRVHFSKTGTAPYNIVLTSDSPLVIVAAIEKYLQELRGVTP